MGSEEQGKLGRQAVRNNANTNPAAPARLHRRRTQGPHPTLGIPHSTASPPPPPVEQSSKRLFAPRCWVGLPLPPLFAHGRYDGFNR